MPYYDTIEQDLARAEEILERGKVRAEDMPVAMRDVAHVAGGTIYGVDTYAAYKLLESFVAEIERLRGERENRLVQQAHAIDAKVRQTVDAEMKELRERAEQAEAGLRQAAKVLDECAEIAGRNDVPQRSQDYEQAAKECWRLAGGPSFSVTLPPQRELRNDSRGQLDDIVIEQVKMFRMERMERSRWWLRLYLADGDVDDDYVFELSTTGRELTVTVEREKR